MIEWTPEAMAAAMQKFREIEMYEISEGAVRADLNAAVKVQGVELFDPAIVEAYRMPIEKFRQIARAEAAERKLAMAVEVLKQIVSLDKRLGRSACAETASRILAELEKSDD